MNRVQTLLDALADSGATERLGWTLLHSLWQGAAVAALLTLALLALRRRPPQARHAASLAALLLLVALPAVTFILLPAPPRPASPAPLASPAYAAADPIPVPERVTPDMPVPRQVMPPPGAPPEPTLRDRLEPLLPRLVAAWLVGVTLFSLWHLGGYLRVRRLRRAGTRPLDDAWQRRFESLRRRLRVSRPVRLLESALVEAPAVAGWLRPVILVPASALSGLPAHELEAILAHELAHVRRNDYLVCVLQAAIETLLFYHPAAWWVSARIRREREDCCDDEAARACGGVIPYARALTNLEALRPAPAPRLALAATGSPLLRRVRRLLGLSPAPAPRVARRAGSLAAAALALTLACLPASVTRLGAQATPSANPASPGGDAAAGPDAVAGFTVKGSVTDARTGEPVKEFRIVRAPADGPPARPARWQSHTRTQHTNGAFEIPLERAWPRTRLRVDAVGYAPGVSRVIEQQPGAVTVDFKLEPAEPLRGVVLSPDGQPLVGAHVTLATVTNEVIVEGARLRPAGDGQPPEAYPHTGDGGAFQLPPDADPGTVVAAHFLGYAEVPATEFAKDNRITLRPWGKVSGRLDVPRSEREEFFVNVNSSRPAGDAPYITHYTTVRPADDGTFEVGDFGPGRAQVGVFVRGGQGTHYAIVGTYAEVEVPSGGTTEVTLGGRGRPVTGRVVADGLAAAAVDWSRVKLRLFLEAPHIGVGGGEAIWRAHQQFLSGERGKRYSREFTPAADGTFRLEDVPQGRYQLTGPVRMAGRVVVAPMPGGKTDDPLHLGDVPLTGQPPKKDATAQAAAGGAKADPNNPDVAAAEHELSEEEIAHADPQMETKMNSRDRARRELAAIREHYGAQHPKVVDQARLVRVAEDEVAAYASTYRRRRKADDAARFAQYYIGGDVPRPGVFRLEGRRVNLLQALIAAGFDPTRSAAHEVQLFRRKAGEDRETVTSLAVKDLLEHRDRDVFLRADDVVLVKPRPGNVDAGAAEGR